MHKNLYFWVIVAVIAGALLGHFAPEAAVSAKPLADGFIRLIKMLIAPLIFCTIVTGIAGMRSMKNAGRVGLKALVYFELLTTLALALGLIVVNAVKPGAGIHATPGSLAAGGVEGYVAAADAQGGVVGFLLHIIPDTLMGAFASGDMLQILLVSILFAAGVLILGERGFPLLQLIQQFAEVLFRIVGLIVKLAPLGAFGAMAFTVGRYGIEALGPLAGLLACFYLTCVLFVGAVLGFVMRVCGLRLWPLLCYLREELFVVLGTSSSEAALPRLMQKLEQLGCSRPVVGMVVPTGYSFNLDGTSIYLTMAALFIAQALGVPLSWEAQLALLGTLLLMSKGAAGVTGSGFVVLAATLSATGTVPVEGLALILGIDRFMSEARAITNVIGNAVGTIAVARWEGALDVAQARGVLSRR